MDTLPDEVLDIIFRLCEEYAAFVSLVCKRLLQAEKRNREGLTRRCAVNSAFTRMETVQYALLQKKFACFVQTPRQIEWTRMAKHAALRSGDIEVVLNICSDTRLDFRLAQVARWNRMNVLLDPTSRCLVDRIDSIVGRLASSSHMLLNTAELLTKRFVEFVVVPALCGGSMDFLRWVFGQMQKRRLKSPCAWDMLISWKYSLVPMLMAKAAMSARDAIPPLEFVCALLADTKIRFNEIETVRRHVAAVGLVMSKSSITNSALEWCKCRASSFSALVRGFNDDVDNGICIVPVNQVHLAVNRTCFRPKLLASYNFLRRETQSGGWMHGAFRELDAYETSCIEWEMLVLVVSSAFGDIDTLEKRNLVVAIVTDCFASAAEKSVPTPRALCKQMDLLSKKSVYVSYIAARSVLRMLRLRVPAETCPVHDVIYHLLYSKGCILYTMLLRAVYTGLVDVVRGVLAPGVDTGKHLDNVQHDNVLTVAMQKDSAIMVDTILASGDFSPTRSMVVRAASQRRNHFLHAALIFDIKLVHSDIGQAACTARDPVTINVAMQHGCFALNSPLMANAMSILTEQSKSNDATHYKKRRRMSTEFLTFALLKECQARA